MTLRALAAALLATALTAGPALGQAVASPAPDGTRVPRRERPARPLPPLDPLPRRDPAIAGPALGREVVAYLPWWIIDGSFDGAPRYTVADDPWIRDGRITDLVLFSVGIRRDGSLDLRAPNARALLSDAATEIIRTAHARGIRVLISFVSGGYENNRILFSDRGAMLRFAREAAALVALRGADGADLDVELIRRWQFRGWARTATLLRGFLRRTDPQARVTVAVNGSTSGARMATMAHIAGVDRTFLMGYAYRGPTTSPVGSISPLRMAGDLDLEESIALFRERGADLSRVVLGLPAYGLSWPVGGPRPHARRLGGGRLPDGLVTTFHVARTGPRPGFAYAEGRDAEEGSVWARWWDPAGGRWWQRWTEDPEGWRERIVRVLELGLAGVGIWAHGYIGDAPGYDTVIGAVLGGPVVARAATTAPATASRTVTLRAEVIGARGPVRWVRLANGDGGAPGPWLVPRGGVVETTWLLPEGPDGPRTIAVHARDVAGRQSVPLPVTVLLDRTGPALADLALHPVAGGVRVAWTAEDATGIAEVRIRTRTGSDAFGPWRVVRTPADLFLAVATDAAAAVELSATDVLGNVAGATIERAAGADAAGG